MCTGGKWNYEKAGKRVMRYRTADMRKAWEVGGYRERYAMRNGNKVMKYINGHMCFVFTYSKRNEYQDANGATYDTVQKQWIG